jgi:hypothetical protein
LVGFETKSKKYLICEFEYLLDALKSVVSLLELVLLHEASSGYFGVRSAQLRVSFLSRNESSVLWDRV